jgi:hypothetical protein
LGRQGGSRDENPHTCGAGDRQRADRSKGGRANPFADSRGGRSSRYIGSLLLEVTATDTGVFAIAALVVFAVAVLEDFASVVSFAILLVSGRIPRSPIGVARRTGRRFSSVGIVCLCLAAAVACAADTVIGPPLPDGSVLFTPPAYYAEWWSMTEACSGLDGSLASVAWYSTPPTAVLVSAAENPDGYWTSAGNRIVLREELIGQGSFVRHEMLHALAQVPGHPRSQFLERCAGTVGCDPHCIADAGPPPVPPADTPLVPPDSFDLAIELSRDTVSPSPNGGYLAVTVSARNRASHAVVAAVPLVGSQPALPLTFAVDMVRDSHLGATSETGMSHLVLDSEALFFAAGETKRQVFDFMAPQDILSLTGSYHVTGMFGRVVTPSRLFMVAP